MEDLREMSKKSSNVRPAATLLLFFFCARLLPAQETIVAIRHAGEASRRFGAALLQRLQPRPGAARCLDSPVRQAGRDLRPQSIPRIIDGLHLYFYVRPLTTIEPTAISLEMPVNTRVGYNKITTLKTELTAHSNRSKLIFVAWEHRELNDFAKLMLRSYGQKVRRSRLAG